MSNPIDNNSRIPGANVGGTQRGDKAQERNDAARGAKDTATPAKGDQSVESSRLQALRERIDNTAEVDRDRVESLKERIASGEYVVDPKRVASKFAELEGLLSD